MSPRHKVKKHVHRYFRSHGKHVSVWKCSDMHCPHYVHYSQSYVLISRASICWGCGREFPLDEDALEEDMPRCIECRSGLKEKDIARFIEEKERNAS
jgi:hypothetical protein